MNGKYWNEEIETMPRKQLEKLQVERLKKTVEIAMGSEFYAPKFKELGITPESIKSVEDIKRFPFTTKNDLHLSFRNQVSSPGKSSTPALIKRYHRQPHRYPSYSERP